MFRLSRTSRRALSLLPSRRQSEPTSLTPPAYHLLRSKERTIERFERYSHEEMQLIDPEYQIFGCADLVGGRRHYSRPSRYTVTKLLEKTEPMIMFERVKSLGGRFMALDVDDSSVGVAISDDDYQKATPIDNLKDLPAISVSHLSELHALVLKHNVKGFVIGESLTPLGESQDDSTKKGIERYVQILVDSGLFNGCQYCYGKENFTSQIAEFLVESCSSLTAKEKKRIADNIAAALILQAFLNKCNGFVI